jgi:flagellar assembly protein FliH
MMSTSSSTAAGRALAQVESFIYPDSDGTEAPAVPPGTADRVPQQATPNETSGRISQDEMARFLADARAQGIREGEQNGRASIESELAQERARIANVLDTFEKERQTYYSKVEVELVHFALAIAAKILHREAHIDRMVVAGLVKVMLEKMQQNTKVVVRIHPEGSEEWRRHFQENATVQIVEDPALQPKDCILETDMGTASVGLDEQLKEIEKGFFDLLAQRPEPK